MLESISDSRLFLYLNVSTLYLGSIISGARGGGRRGEGCTLYTGTQVAVEIPPPSPPSPSESVGSYPLYSLAWLSAFLLYIFSIYLAFTLRSHTCERESKKVALFCG